MNAYEYLFLLGVVVGATVVAPIWALVVIKIAEKLQKGGSKE